MKQLLESWMNGNRKDVAAELLNRGPAELIRFVTVLVKHNKGNAAAWENDVETLARILEHMADDYTPPETPW